MKLRRVGNSELSVSEIGLGCNNFGFTTSDDIATTIVDAALDRGVTLFDTAPVYGASFGASELFLGKVLGSRRKDVVLTTKFGMKADYSRDTSGASVIQDLEDSLKRLQTDYIDLYLLHWSDGITPIEETLRALEELVSAGKVRYVGCCNLPAWRVIEAKWVSKTEKLCDFIVTQDEYSLANRSAEAQLLPALNEYQMGLIPYGPLANGLLSGKYSTDAAPPADSRLGKNIWNMGDRFLTPENLALAGRLKQFAEQRGHTLLELAVSWLLANPNVCSVIAGARTLEQFEMNSSAGNWVLSEEELQSVDQLCSGQS